MTTQAIGSTYKKEQIEEKTKNPVSFDIRAQNDSALGKSVTPPSAGSEKRHSSDLSDNGELQFSNQITHTVAQNILHPTSRKGNSELNQAKNMLHAEPVSSKTESNESSRVQKEALTVLLNEDESSLESLDIAPFSQTKAHQNKDDFKEQIENALEEFDFFEKGYDFIEKGIEIIEETNETTHNVTDATKELTEVLGLIFGPVQIVANATEIVVEGKGAIQDFSLGQTRASAERTVLALRSAASGSSAATAFTHCVQIAMEGFDNFIHLEEGAAMNPLTVAAGSLSLAAGAIGFGLETYKFINAREALKNLEAQMRAPFSKEMNLTASLEKIVHQYYVSAEETQTIFDQFPTDPKGLTNAEKKLKKLEKSKYAQFRKLVGKEVAESIYEKLKEIHSKLKFAAKNPDLEISQKILEEAFTQLPDLMLQFKHGLEKEALLHKLKMIAYTVIVAGSAASFATGPAGISVVALGLVGLIAIYITDKKLSAKEVTQKVQNLTKNRPWLAKVIGEKFPDLLVKSEENSSIEEIDDELEPGSVLIQNYEDENDYELEPGATLIRDYSQEIEDNSSYGASLIRDYKTSSDDLNFVEDHFS